MMAIARLKEEMYNARFREQEYLDAIEDIRMSFRQ
jgi:hypothetical protein